MPSTGSRLSGGAPPIRIRRPTFNVSEDAPKYFYRGEKGVTSLLYALSAVFPEGERMFIDAVLHYRDRITNEALQKDVRAFAGQEAQHGRLHEAYNAYAMARGFDVDPISASVKERNALLKKRLPPVARLATTAALEHFTRRSRSTSSTRCRAATSCGCGRTWWCR